MLGSDVLDLDQIREKVRNNEYRTKLEWVGYQKYKETHIFDEEQSVRWNREKVISENKFLEDKRNLYNEDVQRLEDEFYEDCIAAILDYLDVESRRIGELLFNKAWSYGHDSGYDSVINHLEDLLDMQYDILGALKEDKKFNK